MEKPQQLQGKIDAYKQAVKSSEQGRKSAADRIAELESELTTVQAELNKAMSETLANPTAANEAAETKLRKKVADIQMSLAGARERSQYAFTVLGRDHKALAIDAIKTAREYVLTEWAEGEPAKLQAIADAKQAYLQALIEYGEYQRGLTEVFMSAARETNANYIEDAGGVPHLNEPNWGYRAHTQADGHLYTVADSDIKAALRGDMAGILQTKTAGWEVIQ